MRIGPQRQAAVAVFAKSSGRMREVAIERRDWRIGVRLPAAARIERAVTAGVRQQGKGLIVEVERRIKDTAVQIHGRDDGAVVQGKSLAQKIERMLAGLAPRSVPSEPPCLAVAECLSGCHTQPPRRDHWPPVKINPFVVAATRIIGPYAPPQRQCSLKQPLAQFFGFSGESARRSTARLMHRSANPLRHIRVGDAEHTMTLRQELPRNVHGDKKPSRTGHENGLHASPFAA
jgi:hypothetical protein